MPNTTVCPQCGASLPGISLSGDYRCKYCGNIVHLDKANISSEKGGTDFYQPDPPQSVETYEENAKKDEPLKKPVQSPLPPEVVEKLNDTSRFTTQVRKIGFWIIFGILSVCALCGLILFFVFRTVK